MPQYCTSILVSCHLRFVTLWDASSPWILKPFLSIKIEQEVESSTDSLPCVADLCLAEMLLAVGTTSGEIMVFSLNQISVDSRPQIICSVNSLHISKILRVQLCTQLDRLCSTDDDGVISLIKVSTGETLLYTRADIGQYVDYNSPVVKFSCFQFAPPIFQEQTEDSKPRPHLLICGLSNGTLRIFDAISGNELSLNLTIVRNKADRRLSDNEVKAIFCVRQIGKPVKLQHQRVAEKETEDQDLPSLLKEKIFFIICIGNLFQIYNEKFRLVVQKEIGSSILHAKIFSKPSVENSEVLSYALAILDESNSLWIFSLMELEVLLELKLFLNFHLRTTSSKGQFFGLTSDEKVVQTAVLFKEISAGLVDDYERWITTIPEETKSWIYSPMMSKPVQKIPKIKPKKSTGLSKIIGFTKRSLIDKRKNFNPIDQLFNYFLIYCDQFASERCREYKH